MLHVTQKLRSSAVQCFKENCITASSSLYSIVDANVSVYSMKLTRVNKWTKLKTGRTASCHVGHNGTHLITKVKQQWARLVLGRVTIQISSIPGAVKRSTRILWPRKALEKTPRGVIPPACVKYRKTPREKNPKKRMC
jgi:hypothetical protein